MEHHVLDRPLIPSNRRKPSVHNKLMVMEEREDDLDHSNSQVVVAENKCVNFTANAAKPLPMHVEAGRIEQTATKQAKAAGFQENVFKNLALEALAKRKSLGDGLIKKIDFDESKDQVKQNPTVKTMKIDTSSKQPEFLGVKLSPVRKTVEEKKIHFEHISESVLSPTQQRIEERKRMFERPEKDQALAPVRLPGMTGKDTAPTIPLPKTDAHSTTAIAAPIVTKSLSHDVRSTSEKSASVPSANLIQTPSSVSFAVGPAPRNNTAAVSKVSFAQESHPAVVNPPEKEQTPTVHAQVPKLEACSPNQLVSSKQKEEPTMCSTPARKFVPSPRLASSTGRLRPSSGPLFKRNPVEMKRTLSVSDHKTKSSPLFGIVFEPSRRGVLLWVCIAWFVWCVGVVVMRWHRRSFILSKYGRSG